MGGRQVMVGSKDRQSARGTRMLILGCVFLARTSEVLIRARHWQLRLLFVLLGITPASLKTKARNSD